MAIKIKFFMKKQNINKKIFPPNCSYIFSYMLTTSFVVIIYILNLQSKHNRCEVDVMMPIITKLIHDVVSNIMKGKEKRDSQMPCDDYKLSSLPHQRAK